MKTVELLPKGRFLLNGHDDQGKETRYQGRFSMYAIEGWLNDRGIGSYLEFMDRVSVGMSLGEYADLIKWALNDLDRDNLSFTRPRVMDIIDEVFDDITGYDFKNLIFHAVGKIAAVPSATAGGPSIPPDGDGGDGESREIEEEKKSD